MSESDPVAPEVARSLQAEKQREAVQTPEMSIAQTVVPYNRDDVRARYLGLRCSGFTSREAQKYLGIGHSTVSMWRRDAEFKSVEDHMPDYRRQLANEYAHLEFIRNFRLVLEKDFRVLSESLTPRKISVVGNSGKEHELPAPMSDQDFAYLLKARGFYTPQQLEVIERLMNGTNDKSDSFSFEDFILTAARTKQTVTAESKKLTIETVQEG